LFKRLDVDGDGQISWWEWKNVLTASIKGVSEDADMIDPMDPLSIILKAANDAVQCAKPLDSSDELLVARESSSEGEAVSKTVSKLQSMVKALRESNNVLAQRYENAVLDAQQLQQSKGEGEGDPQSPAATSRPVSSPDEQWQQRIREAESKAAANFDAFMNTKHKLDDLEQQLSQSLAAAKAPAQKEVDAAAIARKERAQALQKEIAENMKRLEAIKAGKTRKLEAAVIVMKYLRKFFLPYYLRTKKRRRLLSLWSRLRKQLVKCDTTRQLQRPHLAATHLQRLYRGKQLRKSLDGKGRKAELIQRCFRGKRARDRCDQLKHELAMKKAAERRKRENSAAQKLSNAVVAYSYRCKSQRVRSEREREARALQERNAAATTIQRGAFRLARRKSLKGKLEQDKRQKLELFLQNEKRAEERESRLMNHENDRAMQWRKEEDIARRERELMKRSLSATKIQSAVKEKRRRAVADAYSQRKREFSLFQLERNAVIEQKSRPSIHVGTSHWICSSEEPVVDGAWRAKLGKVMRIDEETRIMQVRYLTKPNPYGEAQYVDRSFSFDHPNLRWHRLMESEEVAIELLEDLFEDVYSRSDSQQALSRSMSDQLATVFADEMLGIIAEETRAAEKLFCFREKEMERCSRELQVWVVGSISELVAVESLAECRAEFERATAAVSEGMVRVAVAELLSSALVRERAIAEVVSRAVVLELIENIKIAPKLAMRSVAPSNASLRRDHRGAPDESHWMDDDSTIESAAVLHDPLDDDENEVPLLHLPDIKEGDDDRVAIPPIARCADGYYVSYSSDGREINESFGKVVAVDLDKRLIAINFNGTELAGGAGKHKWVPYNHPFIIWYKSNKSISRSPRSSAVCVNPSAVKPPLHLRDALHYKVHVLHPTAHPGESAYHVGIVTAVDEQKEEVTVSYGMKGGGGGGGGGEDEECVAFRSPLISWMALPRPKTLAGNHSRCIVIYSMDL
jgi:hypothetical protein